MRKSTFACIASMMFLFRSNSQLAQRKLYCHQRRASNKNASKDETVKFQNYNKQLQALLYTLILKQWPKRFKVQCSPNNNDSFTEAYQKHWHCMIVVAHIRSCYDDKCTKPVHSYPGENAANKFLQTMLQEVQYCRNVIRTKFNKPLKISDDGEQNFQNATACHICGKQ